MTVAAGAVKDILRDGAACSAESQRVRKYCK